MDKALAWTAILLGAGLAVGPIALVVWAHWMFATGLAAGSVARLAIVAVLGLALLWQGRWLLRQTRGGAAG